jgi:hypothetical protein
LRGSEALSRREGALGVNDRHTDAALENSTIRDDEPLHTFTRDAELLEYGPGHPSELTARVDENGIDGLQLTTSSCMLEGYARFERCPPMTR